MAPLPRPGWEHHQAALRELRANDEWLARLRRAFMDRVNRTGHARPDSARECEVVMRRVTNGERGCANPTEHRRP